MVQHIDEIDQLVGDPDDPNQVYKSVSNFCIATIYVALAVVAVLSFWKNMRNRAHHIEVEHGKSAQTLFLFFMMLQGIVRSVFFTLLGLYPYVDTVQEISDNYWFFMAVIPSDFFFSTFIILVYIWGRFYNHNFHKRAAIVANVILYLTQLVEIVLFVFESSRPQDVATSEHIRDIISHFVMGSFSLLLGIAFSIYSYRLNKLLGNSMFRTGSKLHLTVSIVCILCFFVRGILVIGEYFIPLTFVFELIYIVPSEIFPTALMLFVFQWSEQSSSGTSSQNHSINGIALNSPQKVRTSSRRPSEKKSFQYTLLPNK